MSLPERYMSPLGTTRTVTTLLSLIVLALPAQAETSSEQAWALLEGAAHSSKPTVRLAGVRVLGLIPAHPQARKLAERALEDVRPEVRIAAAGALGQMRAVSSVPLLEKLTADKDFSVVLAAAHALYVLKSPGGYEVYYALLTGQRKSEGLIAEQMQTLHDPAKMTMLGIEQGIGYVPFAGIGWDALRTLMKKDPSPARAVAASILADDPDPASAKALADATKDKNWIIRLAAVDAIARRGDPALQEKVEPLLWDKRLQVRYAAAAAVLRLNAIAEARRGDRKK